MTKTIDFKRQEIEVNHHLITEAVLKDALQLSKKNPKGKNAMQSFFIELRTIVNELQNSPSPDVLNEF